LALGHHGAQFLNLYEIDILKFQNNLRKIMHLDNHASKCVQKNQPKILCILGWVKKTNI
jgi:hypothetical protein